MECFGRSPKELQCSIRLLDETEINLTVQSNSRGSVLLDHVFTKLNLLEKDYFGLRFLDNHDQTHWLHPSKLISKQIKNGPPYTLYFGVKFYTENPCRLKEEVTRYQFFLQLRMDMLQGRLPCSFHTIAELCAYATQSELGDYDPKQHSEGYVSEFRFIPNQTEELEQEITKIHKKLKGMTPSKAELNFLESACCLDMYGVDLHPVLGDKNVEFFLGLTPSGVVVYKNNLKVACYFWPRISKVHFKDSKFTLVVMNKDGFVDDYIFRSPSRAACKYLWQCCVEQHVFFRLVQTGDHQRRFSFSKSSFKQTYSGRTQREALKAAATLDRPEQEVKRASSRRNNQRSSQPNVAMKNMSMSEDVGLENRNPDGVVLQLAPQPSNSIYVSRFPSNYKQTGGRDSPTSGISTHSVPWEDSQQARVGLFTSADGSPASVRSSASRQKKYWGRSRSPGPHSRHSERSDTESEASYSTRRRKRSGGSDAGSDHESRHHNQHRKRRSRSQGASSGSESECDRQDAGRRRRKKSRERTANSERREGVPEEDRMVRGELREGKEIIIKRLGETEKNASGHSAYHHVKSASPQGKRHTRNTGKSREPADMTSLPYCSNGIAYQSDNLHTMRDSPLVREGCERGPSNNSYPDCLKTAVGLYSNNRQPQRSRDLPVCVNNSAQMNGSRYSDRRCPKNTSHQQRGSSPILGVEALCITHSREDSGLGNENGDLALAESKQTWFSRQPQNGHSAQNFQTSQPNPNNHRTGSYPAASIELNSFGKDMRTSPANSHYDRCNLDSTSSLEPRLDENQFHRARTNVHDHHNTSQSSSSSGQRPMAAGATPKHIDLSMQNNNTKVVVENGGYGDHWSTPIEPHRVFATSSLVDDRDMQNQDMPGIVTALPDIPPGYKPSYRGLRVEL